VIEDALRRALASGVATHIQRDVELPRFHGDGLQPGVDLDDTASLLDAMDAPRARA
jgi:hypothetical protein